MAHVLHGVECVRVRGRAGVGFLWTLACVPLYVRRGEISGKGGDDRTGQRPIA